MRYVSVVLAWAALTVPVVALAQGNTQQESSQSQTTTISAGDHYGAGGLYRFLFGQDYRDLWTTPVRVEVLNMRTFGGGLTPTTAGGGLQTKSLRFRGNDRREYGFRSIDKDPDVLPPEFAGTIVERIVQDQTSSAYPPGPAVTAPLMEAAGILHTNPQMVVLPDDPALGQFRERFAGTLGFIEARAITGPGLEPFAGAAEIIGGNEIFERVLRGPRDRVDTRAFLKARLFDFFIGDWDRHRGQWGWARFGDQPVTHWIALPEDRDMAFIRYDGLLPSLGRITNPQLISFGDDYPSILGLHWNAQEVDRYFLTDLEKPAWDSLATALQTRLTNSAIETAVAALPREYRSIDSTRLVRALKARRDKLPQVADRFYRFLAREVDVHATDESDQVIIERHPDGDTEIALTGAAAGDPYFRRRFDPSETSEIRLYLHGGDDRVEVRGQGSGAITLRIIGGSGSDEVINSSRAGGIRFYTSDGDRISGRGVSVDRRRYTPPPKAAANEPLPRDWGRRWRPVLWGGFGPDVGLFFGTGLYRMQFGFRLQPYASRIRLRAGYATEASTGRAGLLAQFMRSNSRMRVEVEALASGIEVLRFHGLGNETVLDGPNDNEFYRVNQKEFSFKPSLVLPLGPQAELAFGPIVTYYDTEEQPVRFLATIPGLYGSGNFGQLGGQADIRVDTRDVPAAATRGVWLTVGGSVYPEVWDVVSAYGEVHGEAATYLSVTGAPFRPTLALRTGGKKVWGTFPFQEAAFIGDAKTTRLGRQNRFGGDAAVYGNAELRLDIGQIFLVLPGRWGIFGIGDIGRVFLEGESSNRWHPVVGGGIWLSFLTSGGTLTAAMTRSEVGTAFPQRSAVYIQAGFAY